MYPPGPRRRRLEVALSAILLTVGCASSAPPERGIAEVTIAALEWEGNVQVPQSQLKGLVRSRPTSWVPFAKPEPFDESQLADDVERLEEAYRHEGFYRAGVEARVEAGAGADTVVVQILIKEGPAVHIASRTVRVQGPPDPRWPGNLDTDLPGKLGARFRLADYRAGKDLVLQRFARAGFPDAALQGGADLDLERGEAHIRWEVTPGPRIVVGDIRIIGLEATQEDLVRSRIEIAGSEPLDPTRLEATRDRVFGLGVFESVAVVPVRGAKAQAAVPGEVVRRDVEVRVKERPPRRFEAAIGYATDERLRGRLAWRHGNVSGRGITVGGQLRASFLRAKAEAFTERPRFPDAASTGFARFDIGTERLETYDADEAHFEFGIRRSLLGFDATARLGFEWARIENVSREAALLLDEPERTSRLSLIGLDLVRDRRDDPALPTRGTHLRLGVDLSPAALGSDVSFLRLGGQLRAFWPLGGTVLAARVKAGVIQPFGSSEANEVPLTQRYFAGGGDSVRGYRYQHLGPLDLSGDPVGGTTSIAASVEWRFPIWRDVGGVLFLDAGEVGLEPFDLRGDDLRFAAGGGLRYATPVGPLRLDIGVPLNRPEDASRFRVHVSIGHAF